MKKRPAEASKAEQRRGDEGAGHRWDSAAGGAASMDEAAPQRPKVRLPPSYSSSSPSSHSTFSPSSAAQPAKQLSAVSSSSPSPFSVPSLSSSSSDTRQCLQCLRVLPYHLFTPEQWRLAKTNSQCRTCEATLLLSQGGVRRLHKRKWEEIVRVQPDTHLYTHSRHSREEEEEAEEQRMGRRHGTKGREMRDVGEDEGDVEETVGEERLRLSGRSAAVGSTAARSSTLSPTSAAAAPLKVKKRRRRRRRGEDDSDEEAREGVGGARRHHRRRRRPAAALDGREDEGTELSRGAGDAAEAACASSGSVEGVIAVDGFPGRDAEAAQVRRRRKRRKSKRQLAEEDLQRRLQLICLPAQDNPYSRVQQQPPPAQSTSRSGRAPLPHSTLAPPLRLNPDLVSLVRDSFGLTLAKDLDPLLALHSSALNPVYSRYMQRTGTLRNGKVYVAVSGVSPSDDMPPEDSDEEFSLRRTRRSGRRKEDDWQPMLGLFAGVDFAEGDVVTCYGGGLINADSARRRPKTTWTHIRRIRDSQYVKDGRLFSALFDRRQVDMWEQFQLKTHQRKRVPPACQPEHIVKALCTEGHEDEVRAGLLLLDAEARGVLQVGELDRGELLMEVMRHIGVSTHIIDGDAMREVGEKEAAALMQGRPCLVVNLPSATFSASSPNPYAGSSSSSSPPPLLAAPSAPISIAPLFPFPIQELHLPATTLHPLPDTRLTTLMELVQNLHKQARVRLHDTCRDVFHSVSQGGLGFMANTGKRKEINVRVVEVNPRKDGLLPNELFYVCTRPIRKHEEILAPYNNNETKKKQARRKQLTGAAAAAHAAHVARGGEEAEEDDENNAESAEERKGGVGEGEDAAAPSPRPFKLTKQQRERLRRARSLERLRKKRAMQREREEEEQAMEEREEEEEDELDQPPDRRTPRRRPQTDALRGEEKGEGEDREEEDKVEEEPAEMEEDGEKEVVDVPLPRLPRLRIPMVDLSLDDVEVAESAVSSAVGARLSGSSSPPLLLRCSTASSPSPSPLTSVSLSPSPSSSSPSSTPSEASPSPLPRPLSSQPAPSSEPFLSLSTLQAKQQQMQMEMEVVRVKMEAVHGGGRHAASLPGGASSVGVDDDGGGFSVISRVDSPWIPAEILPGRTRARSRLPSAAEASPSILILPFSAQKGKRNRLPV